MKLLFIGDVVGEAGCRAVEKHVPDLRRELGLDCVVANAENAAFHGITRDIASRFYAAGVDGITSGNHMWDQEEIFSLIEDDRRIIRPLNLLKERPGRGFTTLNIGGYRVLLVNALGTLFMKDPVVSPFDSVMEIVTRHPLKSHSDFILVDFHTETTAEKNAMAAWLDGKVSVLAGTHTHIPTADHRVLPKGTAYQTDAGMTCDYDSVIGIDKNIALESFLGQRRHNQGYVAASGEATLCGLFVETDDATGLAKKAEPVRVGGCLAQTSKGQLL